MEKISNLIMAFALSVSVCTVSSATAVDRPHADDDAVLIRRTIPYPRAVDRAPLTSDRLSTTSTRYIDARRGHRPYSTVHRDCVGHASRFFIGGDDHFGISRPENRAYSYSQRTPRTGVTQFTNQTVKVPATQTASAERSIPIIVVIRDDRDEAGPVPRSDAPDMRVRIHKNKPELPTRSGAILIRSDGTVIQVGD